MTEVLEFKGGEDVMVCGDRRGAGVVVNPSDEMRANMGLVKSVLGIFMGLLVGFGFFVGLVFGLLIG